MRARYVTSGPTIPGNLGSNCEMITHNFIVVGDHHFQGKRFIREYCRELWKRNPVCTYCRRPVSRKHKTADHIIPRCQGGENVAGNIALACSFCNQSKGPRSLIEWARDLNEVVQSLYGTGIPSEGGAA